ncbi:NAD-dependent epimerase/dehydratase family protein, partial [Bacillus velezensis]|uniref:NAD-dependent epimerase/dehydratase family protein n=1 Tax=Bacillus velezensis TaxID=492670 RepID=UPI0037BFD7A5
MPLNFQPTKNVTDVSAELAITTLLFSSTSQVFPHSPHFPYTHTTTNLPKSPYPKPKLQSHQYFTQHPSDQLHIP